MQGLGGHGSALGPGTACPQFLQEPPGASSPLAALSPTAPTEVACLAPVFSRACSPRLGPWSAADTDPRAPSPSPLAYTNSHPHPRCYSLASHLARTQPGCSRSSSLAGRSRRPLPPAGAGGHVGMPPGPPASRLPHGPCALLPCLAWGLSFSCPVKPGGKSCAFPTQDLFQVVSGPRPVSTPAPSVIFQTLEQIAWHTFQ